MERMLKSLKVFINKELLKEKILSKEIVRTLGFNMKELNIGLGR